MFQIGNNTEIVENIISLSKESFFHPFKMEYTVMYQTEKETRFIRDQRNQINEYLQPGPILTTLLEIIVEEKITEYPFEQLNFNEGSPIDEIDFFIDSSRGQIETTPDFMRFLREQNYIEENIIFDKEEPSNWVEAPSLAKIELTLEKASDLSTVSFQMFNRYPVKLLSLVSERDLMGTNKHEKINLNNTTVSIDGDTVTVMLGRPIYTKRLTFVIGQFNAEDNNYVTKHNEDKKEVN